MSRKLPLVPLALGGMTAAILLDTILRIWRLHTPIPGSDMAYVWETVCRRGLLATLFLPHNEHILTATRVMAFLDLHLASGSSVLIAAASALTALAVPVAFFLVARTSLFASMEDRLLYLLTLWMAYSNGAHMLAYLDAIMFQHWAVIVFTLAFGVLLARVLAESAGAHALLCTLLLAPLAVLATFSSGNGILCPVVALLLGIVLRMNWRGLLYLFALSILLATLYIRLNPRSTISPFQVLMEDPLNSVIFFLVFLGAPYFREAQWPAESVFWSFDPALAQALGLWVLFLGLGSMVALRVWSRRERDPFVLFHAFLFLFILGSGLLVTITRLPRGLYEGANAKYSPTALLAWISAVSLFLRAYGRHRSVHRSWRRPLWMGCYAGVLIWVIPAHLRESKVFRQHKAREWEASASLESGVYDQSALRCVFVLPKEYFIFAREVLLPAREGPFARNPFHVGAHLSQSGPILTSNDIEFSVREVQRMDSPLGAGVKAFGTAWDRASDRPFTDLAFTDSSGIIIGVGHAVGWWIDPAGQASHQWVGFVRDPASSGRLRAYGLRGRGRKISFVSLGDWTPLEASQ